MTFFIFCSLVAAAFIAANVMSRRYPSIKCALYGHEDAKLGKVKVASDLRWYCPACNREVKPL